MGWFVAGSCTAAQQFGWLIGAYSGAFVDAIAVAMLLSARAYRNGAGSPRRLTAQSLLRALPWLLLIAWSFGAAYSGRPFFFCYATWLAIAAAVVTAPAVAVLMFAAANRVGKRSVRS